MHMGYGVSDCNIKTYYYVNAKMRNLVVLSGVIPEDPSTSRRRSSWSTLPSKRSRLFSLCSIDSSRVKICLSSPIQANVAGSGNGLENVLGLEYGLELGSGSRSRLGLGLGLRLGLEIGIGLNLWLGYGLNVGLNLGVEVRAMVRIRGKGQR